MIVTTSTTDPATGQEYTLTYDPEDPKAILTLESAEGSVVIPRSFLMMLLRSWELEVVHDQFEHWPVKDFRG